jgi:hypothetical protein
MIVYHGTTLNRVKNTFLEGLYVTVNKKKALNYAIESAAYRGKGVPVIAVLEVDTKNLVPDLDEAEGTFITLISSTPIKVETSVKWTKQVREYKRAWKLRNEIMDVKL